MARQVLPIVGAAIGGYFGGPQGAQWGWMIGSMVGNAVDPQVIKGPSIGDLAQQTSQEGGPRPIVFAVSQPIAGNIIVSGPERIVKTTQRQGKGGPKVQTESVLRTYAIGVCEGEKEFLRVWKNNQLVFDITENTQLTHNDNFQFMRKARFFTGSFTQMPSPDLEAIFGVGTTPAHRGTAYMVMADDDLTDSRGAIPQFQFQMGEDTSPVYGDTIVELRFDEEDHSTVFVDTSQYAHPVTGFGPIETNHEDFVCGVGAAKASGSGNYLQIPHDGVMNVGAEDFTIEFWFKFDTASTISGGTFFTKRTFSTVYPFSMTWLTNGEMHVDGSVGNGEAWGLGTTAYNMNILPGDGIVANTWHHIALERFGGIFTFFVDGVPHADTGNPSAVPPIVPGTYLGVLADNTEPLQVLGTSLSGGDIARMDDFVWTPIAKYEGEAFDPPDCRTGASLMLDEVVTAVCDRANLTPDLIDVSELEDDIVHGFTIINTYPAYSALQALSDIYQFDPSNFDAKINFVKRGKNSVATISQDEMVYDDSQKIEQAKRADAIQVPRVLHMNYFDVDGGLATDKQTSERSGDRRNQGETSIASSVLMESNQAAQAIVVNHKIMIENSKGELQFCLPDKFIRFTPADVIIVPSDEVNYRVRLTQIDVRDGYQEYKALRDRQSAYTSNVEGIPSAPQTPPPSSVIGPTVIEILDIHILADVDDNLGLSYYVAVSGLFEAWQGATVELSLDGGENYISSDSTNVAAVMGELLTTMGDHPQAFPDEVNTVQVQINTPLGELLASNLVGMLNGQNLAIIGDELINFADVDEVSENVWEISYFLRGRKGTNPTTHAIGERFVLLQRSTLATIPANLADIGRTLTFRATSLGTDPEEGTVVSVVYTGRSQIEREVGYLEAHRDGSNAVVTWQGIGRLGSGASTAHGLRFAGYRVTFDDGSIEHVETTDDQSLTHDVSGMASPITITVEQMNDFTGAGPATQVTLI